MRWWFASLVVLATGCGSVSPRSEIEGISYGFQAYDDMPVPRDFTFDESDRSWAYRCFENSALNLRSGKFRYVGDRDVGQLVNWYNEQMPLHKWQQVSKSTDDAGRKATLVFTKGSEEATVDIVRETGPSRPDPFTVISMAIGVAAAAE